MYDEIYEVPSILKSPYYYVGFENGAGAGSLDSLIPRTSSYNTTPQCKALLQDYCL